jgi:hypothetical protein
VAEDFGLLEEDTMSVGKVSKEHTALIYKKQKTLERP